MLRRECHRQDELSPQPIWLTWRLDSDHRVECTIQANLLADNAGIPGEKLLPQLVGKDDHMVSTWHCLLRQDVSPQERLVANQLVQKARGQVAAFHLLRPFARACQIELIAGHSSQYLEYLALAFP